MDDSGIRQEVTHQFVLFNILPLPFRTGGFDFSFESLQHLSVEQVFCQFVDHLDVKTHTTVLDLCLGSREQIGSRMPNSGTTAVTASSGRAILLPADILVVQFGSSTEDSDSCWFFSSVG